MMTDLSEHMNAEVIEPSGPPVFDIEVETAVGYELPEAIYHFAACRSQGQKASAQKTKVALVTVDDDGIRQDVEADVVGVDLGKEHGVAFLEVDDDGACSAFAAVLGGGRSWIMAPFAVYYGDEADRDDNFNELQHAAYRWLNEQ
jgi:hypothetical protein